MFTEMERVSDTHRAIRFCTSWATTQENVDKLCNALRTLANR
jgi:threonine aldolase